MNRIINMTTMLLVALAVSASGAEPAKRYVNVDRRGLALQGYDPVAYFTQNKAVKGDKTIVSNYHGATYRFASQDNKSAFDADPVKYEPQFGGFCGYAVSEGHTASIDAEAFVIMDGRLILQYSRKVLGMWNEDPANRLKSADKNWPGIAEKNGK